MRFKNALPFISLLYIFIMTAACESDNAKGGSEKIPAASAVKAPVTDQQQKSSSPELPMKPLAKQYEIETKTLLQAITASKPAAEIEQQASALTQTGLLLIPMIGKKYPQCIAYFEALTKASSQLTQLSLKEIEKDYHRDGKLPKSPDGSCYHGKDLVVHPATVVIMARGGLKTSEEQQSARHELEEVLAHLSSVLQ